MHRILVISLLLLATTTTATDRYVYPDGAGLYATIADAVNASAAGDRIFLMEGTFSGPGNRDVLVDGNIEIRANGGSDVVIDCEGSEAEPHRAFIFEYCDALLYGVTIVNGYAQDGGALSVEEGAVIIERCVLRDNDAAGRGGAVAFFEESYSTLRQTVVARNHADVEAGGVHVRGGSHLTIDQCSFLLNGAPAGGHLYFIEGGGATIDRSILAYAYQGAACEEYYGGTVTATCSNVYGNDGGDWAYCLSGQSGGDNMEVEPELCDPMGGEYGPIASSPMWIGSSCGLIGAVAVDMTWGEPILGIASYGPSMAPHIQSAVAAVRNGGVIVMEDGSYNRYNDLNVDPDGKSFTLRSRSGDPEACLINAWSIIPNNTDRFFRLDDPGDSGTRFEGIGFKDGHIENGDGGAIRIEGALDIAFVDCRFFGNSTFDNGGAVSIDASGTDPATVSFLRCRFVFNHGSDAGGAISGVNWIPSVEDCVFENNFATFGLGGAIYLSGYHGGEIRGCTFDESNAWDGGGALYFEYGGATTTRVIGSDFVDNYVTEFNEFGGGAVMMVRPGSLQFDNCDFTGSHADSLGADMYIFSDTPGHDVTLGACNFTPPADQTDRASSVHVDGVSVDAQECVWEGHEALGDGGALYVSDGDITLTECRIESCRGHLGGGAVFYGGTVSMTDCVWRDNVGVLGNGAFSALRADVSMAYCDVTGNSSYYTSAFGISDGLTGAPHLLDHVLVAGNTSSVGNAGVSLLNANFSLDQCTFHGNDSLDPQVDQAQIMVGHTADVDLYHSLVTGSQTVAGVRFYEHEGVTGTMTAYCSNIWGNAEGDWIGPLAAQLGDDENVSIAPVYCDPVNGVYSVNAVSYCLPDNNPCSTQIGAKGLGCSGPSTDVEAIMPAAVVLEGAHPNPFNPTTTLSYVLPESATVTLTVHDVAGRRVRTLRAGVVEASGRHEVRWDGRDDAGRGAASGVYLVRLVADGQVRLDRMALLR